MTVAALTVVPTAAEPLVDRIRRLQDEARGMAREHVAALEDALSGVSRMAAEIAGGGEAYPVGARELARQLVAECQGRAAALDAILVRTARG
jgi:hypothetical protein